MIFFSIIIPVYNVENYVSCCLESVLNQKVIDIDFEIICVDDGSTDSSLTILQKFQKEYSHVKVISQNNGGLSSARNIGIQNAQGKYVLFLDSDDWLMPNALSVLFANLQDEDILCFNGCKYIEEIKQIKSNVDNIEPIKNITGKNYLNSYLLSRREFPFVCVVLRVYKRDYLMNNSIRFEEGIFHEDNLFTPIVCYCAQTIKVISDVLYVYRVRSGSITTDRNNFCKRNKDVIYIANKLACFFCDIVKYRTSIIDSFVTHHYQVVAGRATIKEWLSLHRMIEWKYYKLVSRGKLRHRVGYFVNRYMPIFSKLFFSIRL